MTEHTLICTISTLTQTLENIESCGAVEIQAKQIDNVRYKVTYKVEDKGGNKMKATVMTVTPEMASKWLESNVYNRNIDPKTVKTYKEAMMAGRWEINGESICFDTLGRLRQGQHRLTAMVESGATLELVIVTEVPYTTNVYDVGKRRTELDYATLRGITLNNLIVAAASLVYYAAGSQMPIRSEKVDYISNDIAEWNKVYTCCYHGASKAILKKAGCLAALFMAFKAGLLTEKQADDFCQIVNSGRPVEGNIPDAPLTLYRTLMQGIKHNGQLMYGNNFQKACLEVTYKAIEDFVGCKHPKQNYKPNGNAVEMCKEFKRLYVKDLKTEGTK